ncbi:hypothetical protein Tco_0712621 [Tanacetum coccineum]
MIRSLMYLTASRPEIQFSTCLCTRYQANPKESYLIVVKRNLDFDYAGCNMDRKSTSGACQLLRGKLVCWSAKKQQSVAMAPTQYKEYLSEFWYTAKTLDDSKIWVSTPTGGIRGDIGYSREIGAKGTLKKSCLLPSSTKDKSLSHPSPPTPVVGEIHKEAHQAAGGPTSLGATNEEEVHPQLSSGHDASADSTAKVDPRLSAPNDRADQISKKIKLEDLLDLLKDTRSAFFTPDSPQDEPIIVSNKSKEEEEVAKDKDTQASSYDKDELEQQKAKAEAKVASLKARPSYLDINQLTDLLVTSLKPKFSKLSASHNFASCLPTELREFPLKFNELSRDIKELKKHVRDVEIKLPRDLKEIPTKLETFTFTISSLTSQVAKLKNIQWELLAEFQALPILVSSVQKKLKTLDSLPSLLNKVTETLNRFATVVENASRATTKDVPSAGQATASPAEGEKNTTKDAKTNLQNELVDILGIDVVEQYHNKKLLFDKYYEKMLKRRKSSKIINCDVITQKGPISLEVYREDGTIEVIANFKVSDLHLAEWREVVQAYPDRKEKGWKTIYGLIKTRMEYLDQTERELKIDFNKPLKEQDPLNELNELTNKKRKRTSDLETIPGQQRNTSHQVQHKEEVHWAAKTVE